MPGYHNCHMRLIVEHPKWGLFLGLSPAKTPIWSLKSMYGWRCASVITFPDLYEVMDFFLPVVSAEDLEVLVTHPSLSRKIHLDLQDLSKMGLLGDRTACLLFFEPAASFC